MRNSRHYFLGKMLSNPERIMAHGIVRVYDRWILANSPPGIRISLGRFRRGHGHEMVLIEFLFAEKNIEDQEFCFSAKYGYHNFFCNNGCLCS
jgi:hypothetical protein